MSRDRRQSRSRPLRSTQVPQSARAISGIRLRVTWLLMCLVVVLVGWCFWRVMGSRQPALPQIDLSKVETTVAATIQKHADEARRQPASGDAWGHLGIVLREYGFRDAARECFRKAEHCDPGNPRWPYAHALTLLVQSPIEALAQLQRTVEICGNIPEAPRYRLSKLLVEQARWSEARFQLEQLLQAKPDFRPATMLLAHSARAEGHLPEAIQFAQKCIDDPRTARAAWSLLAVMYRQQSNSADATQAAQRAAALPNDEGISDPFEAEASLLRGDPRVLAEQAHPLLASGHLNEASALIDRLSREHPNYAETWLLTGRLQLLKKNPTAAEPAFRRHLELDPRSTQGFFQLGLALMALDRFADAAGAFEQAAKLKNDFGPAYFNRGIALVRTGRTLEAKASFRESLRHNPERLDTYILLADLHLRSGERDDARALLRQAQTINPNDPRVRTLQDRLQNQKFDP